MLCTETGRQCDMCANYEKQLVSEQAKADAGKERAASLDIALKQATEELEAVRSLHDDTVRSWQVRTDEDGTADTAQNTQIHKLSVNESAICID